MAQTGAEEFEPRGTLAVMALLGMLILAVWLGMYFLFVSRNLGVGGVYSL